MNHALLNPALWPAASLDSASAPVSAWSAEMDAVIREVTARRDEFDRLTYVPRDAVAVMKKAGVFRASTPKRFGGEAMAPADFLQMVERISVADGSANTYLAPLPLSTQARIYADGPDQVFAGGLYPLQTAQAVDGSWMISGHWHFASGCKGADWIGVGIKDDAPAAAAAPPPLRHRRRPSWPSCLRPRSRSSTTGTSSACKAPAATIRASRTSSSPATGPAPGARWASSTNPLSLPVAGLPGPGPCRGQYRAGARGPRYRHRHVGRRQDHAGRTAPD